MADTSTWRIEPLAEGVVSRVVASGLGLARHPSSSGFYLVAWEDDEPLGHAHLALTSPPELQDVEVRPEHRRRGVAAALTRAAERETSARGHDRLTLTVSESNSAAQGLYRRLGYADSGIAPRRVHGIVQIRTGPLEVDDVLLTWEKSLRPYALVLHGGPGARDYTASLADELDRVLDCEHYQQGRHLQVAGYLGEAAARLRAPAWMVGHSWGGRLALHLAAARPELVRGLILIGSLGGVGDGGWAAASAELARRERELGSRWSAYFGHPTPTPPPIDLTLDQEQYRSTRSDTLAHPPDPDAIAAPALFVHGARDHIPLAAVAETVAQLGNAELRVLEGVGHFPWLERRGAIAEVVVDFVASRSS